MPHHPERRVAIKHRLIRLEKKVWGKKAKQTRGTVGGDKLQPLRNETNKTSLVFRISLLLMTNINLLRVADLHSCGGNLITFMISLNSFKVVIDMKARYLPLIACWENIRMFVCFHSKI